MTRFFNPTFQEKHVLDSFIHSFNHSFIHPIVCLVWVGGEHEDISFVAISKIFLMHIYLFGMKLFDRV